MSDLTIVAAIYDDDTTAPTATNSKALTTSEDCFDYRKIYLAVAETTHTLDSTISTSGYCYIYMNPDYSGSDLASTEYVEFGFTSTTATNYDMKIFPGFTALLPLNDGVDTLYFRPSVQCEISIYAREQ